MRISDVQDALEKPSSARLRPFTKPEGEHEPPHRCKGDPAPGIAIGLIRVPSKRHTVWLGMHKAPEFVQLAFDDMQVSPQVQPHPSAVLSRSIPPCTHGIVVDLDEACRRSDRLAFRSCPHRRLKHRWVYGQVQGGGPRSD
jgi:hypothetical protein